MICRSYFLQGNKKVCLSQSDIPLVRLKLELLLQTWSLPSSKSRQGKNIEFSRSR